LEIFKARILGVDVIHNNRYDNQMKIHSFSNSNNVGKLGEAIFHQVLKKSRVGKFRDVTGDRSYQSKGIDFLIEKGNIGIDVKLDIQTDKTGNIAIEKISKKQNDNIIKKGWAYTSEAHLIAYMYMDSKNFDWVIFFFTTEGARTLIDDYEERPNAIKESFNYGYESVIVRVPINELTHITCIRFPIIGNLGRENINIIKNIILH